ncbi:MAG: hypothetical protein IJO65_14230 [Lachnospiraceae bacterium]|nr:hypothetical protein [Lachnospiraceae bacterium]
MLVNDVGEEDAGKLFLEAVFLCYNDMKCCHLKKMAEYSRNLKRRDRR